MPWIRIFNELEKIEKDNDHSKLLSYLHCTHYYLMDRYKKILSGYGLTVPQSNVLGIIGHFHPLPLSIDEIKEWMLEPGPDVSRIVSRLVQKELVEKVVNIKNRRKVSIKITSKGLKMAKDLNTDKKLMDFTNTISAKDAKLFISILKNLRTK